MSEGKDRFEDRMQRLSAIVETLEKGELPLEEGVALFKEGLLLAKGCREQLETARNEVSVYQEGLLREFSIQGADESGAGEGGRDDA
ncbi:Exodeoxyribonuclease 7 small subunit [Alkalidesulfovibrio alkalitolerans DSM 16529]|jgi:exodeoxyribonuclease VII small subunit|uniref:Exodeoxyribonuclease 7 small subunit n=1 Tax=Alkalidesulfovibrio alkalitolerans DSM 16529 TaxID=1121439 RepID=S7UK96_9BACT|nr:exodeoxyribonuclease VII small subunit [Alkalidesulfovibrio alkalitolerans]EPR34234.1 Exodeoxyribonuclease 7 small subunit [Alkalidesulfovibrio alkalitolerans DSM 16529]